jgi:hypothetical protein
MKQIKLPHPRGEIVKTPEEMEELFAEFRARREAAWNEPLAPRTLRRVPTRPDVRFVYFLQQSAPPGLIKIGVANNVARRKADLERELGSPLVVMGVMRWRNRYPGDNGEFEGQGYLPWWSGRGGTALFAEKLLHQKFSRQRLDRRESQPWGARYEWFRPQPPMLKFINAHAVPLAAAEAAPVHELVFVPIETVRVNPEFNGQPIWNVDLVLPDYL